MSALVGVGGFFVFAFGVISFFINFKKRDKRKKSKYFVLGGIVLFFVGLFIPSPEVTSADKELVTNESSSSVVEEEQSSESDDNDLVEVVSIGQTATVGDVSYVVNGIETASSLGSEYFGESAQGVFLLVNVTVTNNGNEALDVSDSFFSLVNGEKTYDSNTMAAVHANENGESFFVKSINPDLSLTSYVVFDVPQSIIDSSTKQLQVQTGYWGTEKGLINLQ